MKCSKKKRETICNAFINGTQKHTLTSLQTLAIQTDQCNQEPLQLEIDDHVYRNFSSSLDVLPLFVLWSSSSFKYKNNLPPPPLRRHTYGRNWINVHFGLLFLRAASSFYTI